MRRWVAAGVGVAAVAALAIVAFRPSLQDAIRGSGLETWLMLGKRQVEALAREPAQCSTASPPEGAVDVVWIGVDTLRADHLGFQGYARDVSPRLDAFAVESLVFERAIAAAPWTTPSFAAVFTGVHPGALGIRERKPIPPEARTFAEVLCAAGWQTAGIVSHTYLGQRYGFDRGFETWDESNAGGHTYVSSAHLTDRAIERIDELTEDERPFFLFVHYFDPHYDFREHDGFRYSEAYTGPARSERDNIQALRRLAREGALGPADRQHLLDRYDSEIAFTDHHIGRLLDHLKARGRYEGALIAFFADHGEAFAEREDRYIGHGHHVYDTLVHVPLVLRLPRAERVGREARPVGTPDLAATTLSYLGMPASLPGRSLLEGAGEGEASAFAQAWAGGTKTAVALGRWKLIEEEGTGERFLYDAKLDPSEQWNLASRHPEVVEELGARLDAWKAEQAERARAFSETESPTLSEAERDRLRALGYAE